MEIKFDNFVFERYCVNDDVKHLLSFLSSKINDYIPKLLLFKGVEIDKLLEKNYKKIKFQNDKIILKLGKNHGVINEPILNNDIIENLVLTLTINISDYERKNKYLNFVNRIYSTINHEIQHLIEIYFVHIENHKRSKSWDFHRRLKIHEKKYEHFTEWTDILHIFYLMEDHEIRSRVSALYTELQTLNTNDIKELERYLTKTEEYRQCVDFIRLNGEKIIKQLKNKYKSFDLVLNDFVKTVLLKNDDIEITFIKFIKEINKKSLKMKNKLLRLLNNFIIPEGILEEHYEKNIDYSKYISSDSDYFRKLKQEERTKKIDKILKNWFF